MSNSTKTEAVARGLLWEMQELKRLGNPEDVADALLTSDAARWITGASIPVDDGSKL
jgi:3-oxoacyl-[acyl-carrier protein] reductase